MSESRSSTQETDVPAHDCLAEMEYRDYEWSEDCYVDEYVCPICGDRFFQIYEHTHTVDADDEIVVDPSEELIRRLRRRTEETTATEEQATETDQ